MADSSEPDMLVELLAFTIVLPLTMILWPVFKIIDFAVALTRKLGF